MWPKGEIPYKIEGSFDGSDRAAISEAIDYMETNSGIK